MLIYYYYHSDMAQADSQHIKAYDNSSSWSAIAKVTLTHNSHSFTVTYRTEPRFLYLGIICRG